MNGESVAPNPGLDAVQTSVQPPTQWPITFTPLLGHFLGVYVPEADPERDGQYVQLIRVIKIRQLK